jgi:hypothetical protein
MNRIRTGVIFAFTSGGVLSLHAQPAAIQQLQNDQLIRQLQTPPATFATPTNAPDLYPGENLDVGPQRILRQTPRNLYFDVLLDSQVFTTDNANYGSQNQAVSSVVFVNTVQVALTPPPMRLGDGKAALAVGFASQWYNYGNFESLDFNAETAFLSGKYTVGNWQIGAGLNLTRLVDQGGYSETYREFMPNLGVQRILPLNDRMFFAVGDLVDFHLTEVPKALVTTVPKIETRPDLNNRLDNIASLTFTWQPTRHLLIQPYYRFQYSYYEYDSVGNRSRNDYLQSFGVTAAYYFNANVSLRASFNYSRRQSSDPNTPQYLEMNGGPGLTLEIKF